MNQFLVNVFFFRKRIPNENFLVFFFLDNLSPINWNPLSVIFYFFTPTTVRPDPFSNPKFIFLKNRIFDTQKKIRQNEYPKYQTHVVLFINVEEGDTKFI